MTIYTQGGHPILSGGKIASGPGCCCGGITPCNNCQGAASRSITLNLAGISAGGSPTDSATGSIPAIGTGYNGSVTSTSTGNPYLISITCNGDGTWTLNASNPFLALNISWTGNLDCQSNGPAGTEPLTGPGATGPNSIMVGP